MSSPVIALYPGTFDPITLGHEDIVRRAAAMFDEVVIAVARAHHKKTMFTLEQRVDMTRQALDDWPTAPMCAWQPLKVW
jgi:pantetheine-phosphate adenylyltransferase